MTMAVPATATAVSGSSQAHQRNRLALSLFPCLLEEWFVASFSVRKKTAFAARCLFVFFSVFIYYHLSFIIYHLSFSAAQHSTIPVIHHGPCSEPFFLVDERLFQFVSIWSVGGAEVEIAAGPLPFVQQVVEDGIQHA